jgi:O-antigen/teichoic acid export membrane protein
MYLVVAKLIEVFARAGFTVGAAFMLPLRDAGQFGIVVTLVGLVAFAVGWERYIDLQRRLVDAPPHLFDWGVRGAFRLWAFNYALAIPLFVLLLFLWPRLGTLEVALCVGILVGEHVANQIYSLAIVEPRYQKLVGLVAARNLLLLSLIFYAVLVDPERARLEFVLLGWSAISVVSTLLIVPLWLRRMEFAPVEQPAPVASGLFAQHRASLVHFGIGLLGVVALQIDRLTVGSLLPLDQVGIYFRHVLLASFAYQFFNIASYNRKVPLIFARARTHDVADALAIVRRELAKVFAVVLTGYGLLWLADLATGEVLTARVSLSLARAGLLVLGALIRIAADYLGLILNSRMREAWVLRHQLIAFACGTALMVPLTLLCGMWGTAAAIAVTSSLYLTLNGRGAARLTK